MATNLLAALVLATALGSALAGESCCARKARLARLRWIPDANEEPPSHDAEGRPRLIPNPADKKPATWDDDDDGQWEASEIENPAFRWKPRLVPNPDYAPPSYVDGVKSEIMKATPWILVGILTTTVLDALQMPLARLGGVLHGAGPLTGALIGLATPLCSCGALPVAASFVRRGAPLSTVVAFLIASQSAGLDSAAITWGLLGARATLCRLLGALLLAIAAGLAAAYSDRGGRTASRPSRPSPATSADEGSPAAKAKAEVEVGVEVEARAEAKAEAEVEGAVSARACGDGRERGAAWHVGACCLRLGRRALRTALGVTGEVLPAVLLGLALSHAAVHLLPSMTDGRATYDGVADSLDGQAASTPTAASSFLQVGRRLAVRAAVLAASVPVQLCEHSTVTVAAGIQQAGGAPGLAFAFLLAAPAINLPSLLLLATSVREPPPNPHALAAAAPAGGGAGRAMVAAVGLSLLAAALGLSLVVDWLGWDLLVTEEASLHAPSLELPPALVAASPYVIGALAAAAAARALVRSRSLVADTAVDACCPPARGRRGGGTPGRGRAAAGDAGDGDKCDADHADHSDHADHADHVAPRGRRAASPSPSVRPASVRRRRGRSPSTAALRASNTAGRTAGESHAAPRQSRASRRSAWLAHQQQ